jgi:hypothetical protein
MMGPIAVPSSLCRLMLCIRARLYRLRKNSLLGRPGLSSKCASPGLSVRGSGFSNPREYLSFQSQGYLAAASISPGENGPELSNQPLRLFLATAIMLCIRARL